MAQREHVKVEYKVKVFDIGAGLPIIVLNEVEARQRDLFMGDRVEIEYKDKRMSAIVDTSTTLVREGEVGAFIEIVDALKCAPGDKVTILPLGKPASIDYIKKKLDGGELRPSEIEEIIKDLMGNKLSEAELAVFVAAVYSRGINAEETVSLTNAIMRSGDTLEFNVSPVVDKHCVGGVAGNRTTMVVVPILAAAGAYFPKTSSRAITSASGTADTMETLCNVNFTKDEVREIVLKTHGCIVWGGGAHLAPADDKLIRIRYPFRLDPRGMLLASIMAKKKAVGSKYLVIDIPIGRGSKFEDPGRAKDLAKDFIDIGSRLDIKTQVFLTDGSDPIGYGVGPALECRDVLEVLQGRGPQDLFNKSCLLAGSLLEMSSLARKGEGYNMAMGIIKSGKALDKLREIVEAQGGSPNLRIDDLPIGKYKAEIYADADGRVDYISNSNISRIARAAGAPKVKGAGCVLKCEHGDRIRKGEVIFEIYSDSEAKLDYALKVAEEVKPVELQKIVLGEFDRNAF
ncbi:MAG: AMP phosphorylase [Candidatus Micrarchaeota archaeon]|nr:AMP phosphorylase [Candidatus Micrarchaeota archaeon]